MSKLEEEYKRGYEEAIGDFAKRLFDWNQISSKKVPLKAVREIKEGMEQDVKYSGKFIEDYKRVVPTKKFIEQLDTEEDVDFEKVLDYAAGIVISEGDKFIIGYEQIGAQDTFSIGQPVYDSEQNIMGYLGITLNRSLDWWHKTERDLRIPTERWEICLPTEHCKPGKKVFTYWQNKVRGTNND